MDKNEQIIGEAAYSEIPPLFIVQGRRKMTVKELIAALNTYSPDSIIHISISDGIHQALEVKNVSAVVEIGENKTHPVLNIDRIEVISEK